MGREAAGRGAPLSQGATWQEPRVVPGSECPVCPFQRNPLASPGKPAKALAGDQQLEGRKGFRVQDTADTRKGPGATHSIPEQKERLIACLFSSIQGNCFKNPYTGQGFCTPYMIYTMSCIMNESAQGRQGLQMSLRYTQARAVLSSTDLPRRH